MRILFSKILIVTLGCASFFLLARQVKGQVSNAVVDTTILTVNSDGSGTLVQQLTQPAKMTFYDGKVYTNKGCSASPPTNNIPNVITTMSQAKLSNGCRVTLTTTFKDINGLVSASSERFRVTYSNGEIVILNPFWNSDPRYLTKHTYTAVLPYIESFSPPSGTKQGNRITWGLTNSGFPIEIKGRLEINDCQNDDDKASASEIRDALDIIKDNAQSILNAAKEFGVDPHVLAGSILAEQARNFNFVKDLVEPKIAPVLPRLGKSISLGVAQIQMSVAAQVENAGLMPRMATSDARISALLSNDTNIRYAAAYIKYLESRFPNAKGHPGALMNLYNIGERRKDGTPVTVSNPPRYNCFAAEALAQFNSINNALGLNK